MRLFGFKTCLALMVLQISVVATGADNKQSARTDEKTTRFQLSTGTQARDGTSVSVHQGVVEVITPQAHTTVPAGNGMHSQSGGSSELPMEVSGLRAPERVSAEDWLSWTATTNASAYELQIFSDQNRWIAQRTLKQPYLQLDLTAGVYQLQLQSRNRQGLRSSTRTHAIRMMETDIHTAPPQLSINWTNTHLEIQNTAAIDAPDTLVELRLGRELQTIHHRDYLLDYHVMYLTGAQAKRIQRDSGLASHIQYRLIIDDKTVSPLSTIHSVLPVHATEESY